MFDDWKYRREQKKIIKALDRRLRELNPDPGKVVLSAEVDHAIDDANNELMLLHSAKRVRESNRLWDEAVSLDIEAPDEETASEHTPFGRTMTATTRLRLRREIDAEKARRREVYAWWWKTFVVSTSPC